MPIYISYPAQYLVIDEASCGAQAARQAEELIQALLPRSFGEGEGAS
jgi:hypothetical protein